MKVVAVVGASGFAGSNLVETLWADDQVEVRPLIHSSGNCGRLARYGRPLHSVDVLSRPAVDESLAGCTHVVNCSRGSYEVMYEGLKYLLAASRRQGVERFIHLSSSAVYGETFDKTSTINEDDSPRARRGSYGWKKLQQDRLIEDAVRQGLPCVNLCPPNIGGPQSAYFLEVLGAVRSGGFVFIDEGRMPCDLVDVANLTHAIKLALDCPQADGRRIFVTNDEATTWRDLVDGLVALAEPADPPRSMPFEQAQQLNRALAGPRPSLSRAAKHLVSSDVRAILTRDSLLASVEKFARKIALQLPQRAQDWLRGPGEDSTLAKRKSHGYENVYTRLITQQLRNARYSCARARDLLGYQPVVSFAASRDAFGRWYIEHTGFGTEAWSLLRQLY